MTCKHALFYFCLVLVAFSVKAQQNQNSLLDSQPAVPFNAEKMLGHVKILSSDAFQGRRTGTPGAIMAKEYIIKQFKLLDVVPFYKDYQQNFQFEGTDKSYKASNLIGVIKGTEFPESYVVISAHYDHEGIKNGQIYNGADDDASGIAALFAFAEVLKKNPPKHSVVLAAFDAEELGLIGSKYFVANLGEQKQHIKLNINMDMIGRNDKNELYVVGSRYHDFLQQALQKLEQPKGISLKVGHDGTDKLDDWTYASDHAPFFLAKIPFLYFGVEDHKDYHQPTDDFEHIQPEFYTNSVHLIIRSFLTIDTLRF